MWWLDCAVRAPSKWCAFYPCRNLLNDRWIFLEFSRSNGNRIICMREDDGKHNNIYICSVLFTCRTNGTDGWICPNYVRFKYTEKKKWRETKNRNKMNPNSREIYIDVVGWLVARVCVGVLHIRFAILSNIIRIYLCHLNNTWKQKHTFDVLSFVRSDCSFVRNDDVQMPHNGRPVSSSSSSVTTTTFSSEHLARVCDCGRRVRQPHFIHFYCVWTFGSTSTPHRLNRLLLFFTLYL